MSPSEFYGPFSSTTEIAQARRLLKRRSRWWLPLSLFVITLCTTTIFGFALELSFNANRSFSIDSLVEAYVRSLHGDRLLWSGLAFSLPLLFILLLHEMGHYVACQRRNVDATLPYFLPSPMLFGTFGAFIKIRSPIWDRKSLFDIGFSGPAAGFIALVPFLIVGVLLSRVSPGAGGSGDFSFGTPLLLRGMEQLRFPGIPANEILLHPIARAAWTGLLATSINLLPIGQLDGGHILYALWGDLHKPLSRLFLAMLLPLGVFYRGWIFWAVLLFFFGMRHPFIWDPESLDRTRVKLAAVALFIFLVSFSVAPVSPH